jgi:tape measure domain-containing protein
MSAFNVGDIVAKFKVDATGVKKGLTEAQNSIGGVTKASLALKLGLVAAGAVAIKLGKNILDQAGAFEQSQIAFKVMLGSAEEGNRVLRELADFAKRTPFELRGIETTAKQILAMGGNTKTLMAELKMLGDVSAGTGAPLERLALNFNQVRLQGKLTGRELRDFAVNGVPLIAELAKNLNVAESEIAGMVSAGKIGFPEVSEAFRTMSSEGGTFANLMTEQSGTLQGQISNLKDEISLLAREIGAMLLPTAKVLVEFIINSIIPNIREFVMLLVQNKDALIALAIGIMVVMIPAFIAWVIAAGTAAIATLALIWPLLAVGAGVTALAYVILHNWEQIKAWTLSLKNTVVSYLQAIMSFANGWGNRLFDALVSPFRRAWDAIKGIMDRIKNAIREALDFEKRHSPSVMDLVRKGVAGVTDELAKINIDLNHSPRTAMLGALSAPASGGGISVNISMAGAVINDKAGANRMAEMMGDRIISKLQKSVRV